MIEPQPVPMQIGFASEVTEDGRFVKMVITTPVGASVVFIPAHDAERVAGMMAECGKATLQQLHIAKSLPENGKGT